MKQRVEEKRMTESHGRNGSWKSARIEARRAATVW